MARAFRAAALLAASFALGACNSPGDDGLRIIVSSGPVYEVPARDAPHVKPIAQKAGRGTLILEGGGTSVDEASRLTVALAGAKPVLCLIDTTPQGAGAPYHKFDGIGGFKMLTINVATNSSEQASVVDALESCTGYFFNAGDPALLSAAFRPNAEDSAALKIIRRRFERDGAVVAGAGAGAMMAGDLTLCECGPESSVEALTKDTVFEAPGFVFIHGVLIDAHFFARGLIARHLYALADTKEPVGVGIDEATAVVVPGRGGLWQVIGDGSVALIKRGARSSPGHLEGFSISVLNAGDSFDPVTGRVVIAPKRKPLPMARNPAAAPIEVSGIFQPGRALDLIDALARSPSLAARGYDDASAMSVKLSKTPRSAAYGDGSSLSILNFGLAISAS
jgi:cyanophycinase